MRVALYARVSTDEQRKFGYSISDQKRTLAEYAATRGYEILGEPIVDDGISSDDLNRAGLQKIMRLAKNGEIDAVLATRRDRYFRTQLYRLATDQDLAQYGVKLLALDDTGNRIADGVLDAFSEEEKKKFAARSRAGKRERAKQGKVIPSGNNFPYGFAYNHDRSNYVIDPVTMPVILRMFEMVAKGTSLKGVCRALDADGVPTPGGSPFWNPITVRRFLTQDSHRYAPHTIEELRELGVAADVLDRLDPDEQYGIWYYGVSRISETGKRQR